LRTKSNLHWNFASGNVLIDEMRAGDAGAYLDRFFFFVGGMKGRRRNVSVHFSVPNGGVMLQCFGLLLFFDWVLAHI